MKLAQVLLLNVATVVLALVVYDQLRDDASGPSIERARTARSDGIDSLALERRLQALEARRPANVHIDRELPAKERAPKAEVEAPRATGKTASPERGKADDAWVDPDQPTDEEVKRFRQLQEAVRRENEIKKNYERVEKALGNLSINLTRKQRARIHAARAEFEPNIVRIWGEVKTEALTARENGEQVDRKQYYEMGTQRVQQEFATSLSGIVDHPGDAQAVAAAVMTRGK